MQPRRICSAAVTFLENPCLKNPELSHLVHPDVFRLKWNLQLAATLALPNLISSNLFDF
jgi:hypothetical protein